MLDKEAAVIYIGKAKNLKKRVQSYFSKSSSDFKTQIMVSHIQDIDIIVTESESAALLLESQMVRELQPKYNVRLKDDKSYPYLKLTRDPFPRLMIVRDKKNDGGRYFGPYPSMGSCKALQKSLYDFYPIRECKQHISLTHKDPKCILMDIGRCIGPCVKKDIKADYDELVDQVALLLLGRSRDLLKALRDQMKSFSDRQAFEKAAVIRDRILKIERLFEAQHVRLMKEESMQVWAEASDSDFSYVIVQDIVDGHLLGQHGFYYPKTSRMTLDDFIEQSWLSFFSDTVFPKQIICSTQIQSAIQTASLCPETTLVSVPMRGPKVAILAAAQKNASIALKRLRRSSEEVSDNTDLLAHLKTVCRLSNVPFRIMGFDISHLQGTNIVASSVVFENGQPNKSQYRKFQIRSVEGDSNDPASMREVVFRRLKHCLDQQLPLPDLILIDGGIAQLNFAIQALEELDVLLLVDVLAIAKREELLFKYQEPHPIRLAHSDKALHLLQSVRDESHRFAVRFQRQRRHKIGLKSVLNDIPGLGSKRLDALYQEFKTLDGVRLASVEEISRAGKLGTTLAQRIKDALRGE